MRPLELELEGFTSFRTRTLVAFQDLDLFAITGPTGAGKTSLLDAIVVALYGRTPRLTREINQLVSRGLKHMRVRFDFSVGEEQYRVVRSWQILPKSVKTAVSLEQQENGGFTPLAGKAGEVEDQITRLIGLDFDSFIRSVVLPQGEFDLFLQGEPSERRKILHHLLRMGGYERIFRLATDRAQACRQEVKLIEMQLDQLALATAESLAACRQTQTGLEAEAKTLAAGMRKVQAAELKAAGLVVHLGKIAEAETEATRLVAEHAAAETRLKDAAERESSSAQAIVELKAKLAANPHDDKRYFELDRAEGEAKNLREAETAQARAAAEETLAGRKIGELERQLESAQAAATKEATNLAGARETLAKSVAARDTLARRFGSLARLAEHFAAEEARIKVKADQDERKAIRAALEVEVKRIEAALARAKSAQTEAAAEKAKAAAELEAARATHTALALRRHLHRGEPCPVCEQPVSTLPAKRKLAGIERAQAACERASAREGECIQEAARLAAAVEAGKQRAKQIERDLKRLGDEQDSIAAKIESYLGAPPAAGTLKQLARGRADFERAEEAFKECQTQAQSAQEAAAASALLAERIEATLAGEKKARAIRARGLAESENRIAELRRALSRLVGEVPDLKAAVAAALTAARQAKTKHEAILKECEAEEQRLGGARAEAAATRAVLDSVDKQRATSAEHVRRAAVRAEAERAELTQCAAEIGLQLRQSATGEAEREAIAERLRELDEQRVELAQRRALAAKEETQLTADLDKRGRLSEQQAKVGRQATLAETLADDLKVNHFVAYLIEEALQALAADASRHLQTFPDRSFSLAVEGQDFLVIDHANADEKRSVKTLSGGESFNASLALAIAFAESLADQAGATAGKQPAVLESLFLDEGFGTLDAENLDAVAGAIEALYGGRTVGIITHMPELAQRMPARIVVTKQGNTSQVQVESG